MHKYIDFDGVIKYTHMSLFSDYLEKQASGIYVNDILHVKNKNWLIVLKNSPIINDAINIINTLDNVSICTRIHSLENEGVAKIKDLRNLGVNVTLF